MRKLETLNKSKTKFGNKTIPNLKLQEKSIGGGSAVFKPSPPKPKKPLTQLGDLKKKPFMKTMQPAQNGFNLKGGKVKRFRLSNKSFTRMGTAPN